MSYYKKLFATNILVSTAYILFFSLIISLFSFFSAKKIYENNMIDHMNNLSVDINGSISNAKKLANILQNSEYIQNYADETAPDYLNRQRVFELFHEEINMLLTNGAQIAVTKYYDNHIISSSSSSFDFYSETHGISSEDMERMLDDFNKSSINSIEYLFSRTAKIDFLTIVIRSFTPAKNQYFVLVTYPINTLMNTGRYSSVLIPAVSIRNDLVYIGDERLLAPVSDYLKTKKAHGYRIFSFSPDSANSVSDFTYHFIIRNKYYLLTFVPEILWAFFLCIPLFIIGIFLMRRITDKIYQPISNLMSVLSNKDLSTENEFDFVISEFNKLKSKDNVNSKIISKFKMNSKDKFIVDLLFGTLSAREIAQSEDEYNLPPISNEVVVVIIEYNNYNELLRNFSRRGLFDLKTTVNSLLTSIFDDVKPMIITETSPNNHVMIVGINDLNSLRASLQTSLLQVMEDMNIDISASIGQPVDSYINLCDSYYSAIEVSRSQSLDFSHKVVATSLDAKTDRENRIIYLPQSEQGLIYAVSTCNFEQVHSILQQIFRESHVNSNDGFAQLVIMLYSTVQKILYNLNLSEKSVFGENTSIYLDLRGCQSVSSLKAAFTAQLNTLMNYISSTYSEKSAERSDEMKKYIESHYTEDISLLNLAEFMNMSLEHTSRIFKQETGTNFKEYLMRLRYEKAMEIMKDDPNLRLKDVALAVGCLNAKNLSRLINRYKE